MYNPTVMMMKKILEILTEHLDLSTAVRLKDAQKGMEVRWAKKELLPTVIGLVLVLMFCFSVVVISETIDGTYADMDIENTVGGMVMLVMGVIVGMFFQFNYVAEAVTRIIRPIIDKAIDKALEKEIEEDGKEMD